MSPAILATIITVLLTILVGLLTRYGLRGRDDAGLSLICEDRTEDELVAERPTDPIDEALAATTDRAEQDALLDVRLRAMGGAG